MKKFFDMDRIYRDEGEGNGGGDIDNGDFARKQAERHSDESPEKHYDDSGKRRYGLGSLITAGVLSVATTLGIGYFVFLRPLGNKSELNDLNQGARIITLENKFDFLNDTLNQYISGDHEIAINWDSVKQIQDINYRVAGNEDSVRGLRNDLGVLSGNQYLANKNISELNSSNEKLKSIVDKTDGKVTSLEKTVADHERRIGLLEDYVYPPKVSEDVISAVDSLVNYYNANVKERGAFLDIGEGFGLSSIMDGRNKKKFDKIVMENSSIHSGIASLNPANENYAVNVNGIARKIFLEYAVSGHLNLGLDNSMPKNKRTQLDVIEERAPDWLMELQE